MNGGKKLKISAFIADYTSTFVTVIFIYLLYDYSGMRAVLEKRFSASRRDEFFTLLIVCLIIHIIRTICTLYIYRNLNNPDRAEKSFYRCAVAAVLSVVWFVIILIQMISKNWLIWYKGLDAIMFVLSLVDFVVYPIILYYTHKTSKQVYAPDAMTATQGNPKQVLPPIKLPQQNGFAQQQVNKDDNTKA